MFSMISVAVYDTHGPEECTYIVNHGTDTNLEGNFSQWGEVKGSRVVKTGKKGGGAENRFLKWQQPEELGKTFCNAA